VKSEGKLKALSDPRLYAKGRKWMGKQRDGE